jgi:hypothetical protein
LARWQAQAQRAHSNARRHNASPQRLATTRATPSLTRQT